MAWRFDERIDVATGDGHVTVHRSGSPGRPVALMTHGTGLSASTLVGLAALLADEFEVYAFDRRGHGSSSAPAEDDYDFADFTADAIRVIDALGLRDVYAVAHSAGATDLLLAAAERPHAFHRIVAIEPTAMDPAEPGVRADLAPQHAEALAAFTRRRATFASRAEVIERYTGRGGYAGWHPDVLEAYVRDGFVDQADGTVTLSCTPTAEVAMLRRIFATMEGTYRPASGPHPFDALRTVTAPTLVITTEQSAPIYRQMGEVVVRLLPNASHVRLDGLGHSAAQVDPDRVAAEVLRFWHDDGASDR